MQIDRERPKPAAVERWPLRRNGAGRKPPFQSYISVLGYPFLIFIIVWVLPFPNYGRGPAHTPSKQKTFPQHTDGQKHPLGKEEGTPAPPKANFGFVQHHLVGTLLSQWGENL